MRLKLDPLLVLINDLKRVHGKDEVVSCEVVNPDDCFVSHFPASRTDLDNHDIINIREK